MTFLLRPYQQHSCDAAIKWMLASVDPCLIDAAPAAGKSYMIAHIANTLNKISGGKRVLCLAPSAELVKQNHEKFVLTGESASIFSASAGVKSTRHVVVFGTPGTVKNAISRFKDGFAGVIIDECHGTTPTIRAIIEEMRKNQPNLRVLGLSGTPFVLGKGYIFRMWPDGRVNGDDVSRDPYFTKCVYRVSAREMLDEGFITPMIIGQTGTVEGYDTSAIELLPNGHFNTSDVERAFEGHGRKTAAIVADVIDKSRGRSGGIMYFAATVRHAHEIMASLPPETSALVTGDDCLWHGKSAPRKAVIAAYRAQKIRHLVSVGTLTTGFDVAHTAVIALLRYTESAALLQQIMGRAWRLFAGKLDSLLLDYAENVERHFPDGDIYNPVIKAGKGPGDGEGIDAECPDCGYGNNFSLDMKYADYQRDAHGYCMDMFGEPIMTAYGPMPAHYGRRCMGMVKTGAKGEYERCGYRWTGKDCPHCGEKNDIAARFCFVCKGEIVDPNDRLIGEFKAMKKNPCHPQTDDIISLTTKESISARGNATIRADFVTPYRQFSCWFMKEPKGLRQQRELADFVAATKDGTPNSVTYKKDADSGFFRILAFNKEPDRMPKQIG